MTVTTIEIIENEPKESKKYPKTFLEWFKTNLSESAHDISENGADSGFSHITYTSECCEIFDKYSVEIWKMAVQDSSDSGYQSVMHFIADFNRIDMVSTFDGFKNLLVWYAVEKLAFEITQELEELELEEDLEDDESDYIED